MRPANIRKNYDFKKTLVYFAYFSYISFLLKIQEYFLHFFNAARETFL
jgi:hypothetical protein